MSDAAFTVSVEVLVIQRDPAGEELAVLQVEDGGAWRLPGATVPSGTDVPEAARKALASETGLELALARLLALDETTTANQLVLVMDGGFVGPDRAALISVMSEEVESLPRSRWVSFDDLQDGPRRIGYAMAATLADPPPPVLVDGVSDVERWHVPVPSDPTAP